MSYLPSEYSILDVQAYTRLIAERVKRTAAANPHAKKNKDEDEDDGNGMNEVMAAMGDEDISAKDDERSLEQQYPGAVVYDEELRGDLKRLLELEKREKEDGRIEIAMIASPGRIRLALTGSRMKVCMNSTLRAVMYWATSS